MGSLANTKFIANNPNDTSKSYYFSICSSVGEPCLESSGSCEVNRLGQSQKIGEMNENLHVDENGSIYLIYKNGAFCTQNLKKTTKIQFICINGNQKEGPVLIEDTNCEILIHFNTKLACPKNDVCKTKTPEEDDEIDLEALINNEDNYLAIVNETTLPNEKSPIQYIINVCRPLVSKYGLNCQGGACRSVVAKDGKHEQEMVWP